MKRAIAVILSSAASGPCWPTITVRYGMQRNWPARSGRTRRRRVALADPGLDHLWVVYPGTDRHDLDKEITVVPAASLPALSKELPGNP